MGFTDIVILVLMLATLGVLVLGVVTMMRSGEAHRKNSNKLMSLRVALQASVVVLLGFLFMFGKH